MGLFSVRGRLTRSSGYRSPIRLHSEYSLAALARGMGALPQRLRVALVAATNDARIVAVLLVLAAVALGFEMAASFHLI
ncbi:MAG: hypothetical protein E6J25_03160 [Chloroflexi bacterium]|nr:MAG: hypothetical protein E6J25_03160 [Chloroflexota bacterium]TME55932.1 MAG: hypothetical protein E6I60_04990 [Chloroflexota bacterium]